MIHGRSSLSVGDVKMFEMLAQICGEELREGREVHIEGLGYFAPILRSTQKVTRSTKNKWLKMELKTIGFRPDARLRGELVGAKGQPEQVCTPFGILVGSGDRYAAEGIFRRS